MQYLDCSAGSNILKFSFTIQSIPQAQVYIRSCSHLCVSKTISEKAQLCTHHNYQSSNLDHDLIRPFQNIGSTFHQSLNQNRYCFRILVLSTSVKDGLHINLKKNQNSSSFFFFFYKSKHSSGSLSKPLASFLLNQPKLQFLIG